MSPATAAKLKVAQQQAGQACSEADTANSQSFNQMNGPMGHMNDIKQKFDSQQQPISAANSQSSA